MGDIILQGISKDDLVDDISAAIVDKLNGVFPTIHPSKKNLVDRKEAAEYLNISLRKLDIITGKGNLKYLKIDGCVRFKQSELDAFIEKNEVIIKKIQGKCQR